MVRSLGGSSDIVQMRRAWIQALRATTTSHGHALPDATGTSARKMARRMSFARWPFSSWCSPTLSSSTFTPVEPVLREVQRVLRPGGRFLFTTPAPRLYSRDTYQWRRMLAPVGLDWIGRRMASRENDAYHHVSIFDFQTWRTKLEAVGFEQVEQVTYLPVPVARVLTGFSGAIRQPLLQRHAWRLSREARALSAPAVPTELQWIESSRAILAPLLQPVPNSDQCGQLLLATKGRVEAVADALDWSGMDGLRILWLFRHRTARFEEVNAMLRAGAEVIPIGGIFEDLPNAVEYPRRR